MEPMQDVEGPSGSLNTVATFDKSNNGGESDAMEVQATGGVDAGNDVKEAALKVQDVVQEFEYLLEKSQQLFAGLRDLPPTGSSRQWQPYFHKTFEVYTKLWQFQMYNRFILEDKNNYGLKRWEVGEIASKIGQLYYHYYLRTSETNYLKEAYVFYGAIRDRQYFKDILDSQNPALRIKNMRFYARYIVVCLLLNQHDVVKTLVKELETQVDDYTKMFKPADAAQWQNVLQEISTFMDAEKKLIPIGQDGKPVPVLGRLQLENSTAPDRDSKGRLQLQEAILVGNHQHQIKFSELTLDMYRMLQSLEREPYGKEKESTAGNSTEEAPAPERTIKRANPHKYLLYRPTQSQLMVYLAAAFKEIDENSVLLLYISADGYTRNSASEKAEMITIPGYQEGVALSYSKSSSDKEEIKDRSSNHALYPLDLLPCTRKPLFLIVDSSSSRAFQELPNAFNQPFLCLSSPTEYPSSIQDVTEIGSLFTLFLHNPILGFSFISDIAEMDPATWKECNRIIAQAENKVTDQLHVSPSLNNLVRRFLQDDFLRQLIVRFVICHILMRSHTAFKEEKYFPSSFPALSQDVLYSKEVVNLLGELTVAANVVSYYSFSLISTKAENAGSA
ncbi:hypothetical protein BZG36_03094 [Bifiguratus adelaidae]|uniref:Protein SCAI n=1 Tax=Bifiguratus adelaidae TaxID=1938954 RepID=A0A261XYW7_9FUNG|nr:hypothetical protein BZG36_03094 [Bifiguratus adelaidae]